MRSSAIFSAFIVFLFSAAQAPAQSNVATVGVLQMEDLAQTGSAENFSAMVETAIARTGRFRVIPRERLAGLLAQRERPRGRNSLARNRGSTANASGVDYLIHGTITSVSSRNRTNIGTSLLGGILSGLRGTDGNVQCANQEATLAVDIRVTDAGNREIRSVTRVAETQRVAAVCSGQVEIDIRALERVAAERIATALVTAIYPIQIAALQGDGTIILNYGAGTVQVGAILTVYSNGQPIRDPTTGQVIGNEETKLGHVRVNEVSERMSRATAVGTFTAPPQVGAVLRAATQEDVRALSRSQRRGRSRR